MQKQLIRYFAGAVAVAGLTASAHAVDGVDTFYTGLQVVAVGSAPAFGAFDPIAQSATTRMYNDGATAGDTATGPADHVWTRVVSGLPGAGSATDTATWKMATTDGVATWQEQAPNAGDCVYPTNATSVAFHWVDPDGSVGDGWLPDNDFVYTVPNNVSARLAAAGGLWIWGNFGAEIGAGDWGGAGTDVDAQLTLSSGIWSKSYPAGTLSAGSKQFKFTTGAWGAANEIGDNGVAGGNIAFTVIDPSDAVTFEVRDSDGRYRITGLTTLPPTPGLYVVGPFATPPVMVSTANGYEVEATTNVAAGNYTLNILDWDGTAVTKTYPQQGAHPIKITSTNQQIRVSLRTAAMGDGGHPDKDFIYTDPACRHTWTGTGGRVQITGCLDLWGTLLSTAGNQWDSDPVTAAAANATDTGDGFLFRLAPANYGSLPAPPGNDRPYKAIATTPDRPSATGFSIQVGGFDQDNNGSVRDGLTLGGDNENPVFSFPSAADVEFFVDMAVGRTMVRTVTVGAPNLRPPGSENAVGSSAVSDWTAY